MNPIKNISNNESAQNHICPATGLPIFRRPEWSDIYIAEDYAVSFSLIGNAILCTVANGILSNKGTRRLLEERKKVLKEANLWDKRYAEIRDYSMLKGRPSKESRMMFANSVLKEADEGRLIGFWGFNAPLFLRWMFNVGVKLNAPSVPVAAVKDYSEAVEHAVNVLMQNEINIGIRQYKLFTKEDWSVELDNFGVRFELIGNNVLYSVAHGSLKEDYVEIFFKLHEKVLDESGLKGKGCFYRILNWEKLEKTTWKARRMYIDGIKDLNKKVPCRLSVGFGLNKFMRAIIRVSKQFVPFPVALTNNFEEAMTIIGREKQKNTKTKIVKKRRNLLGKTSVEDQIRNYSDELLQFIGTINWDHTGISAEDIRDSHPFKLVFDAIAIIKEDVDDLFQERKQAEETLRENEEKYRTILENIEDGYFEVDIAGNFTFFNDSLVKILGYSKDELTGMNNLQYTDKENAKKLYETFKRVYKTGEPTKAFDWELIRKDGAKRYVEASVSLMKDSESQPIGFRGIARDSTERKLAEKERAKLKSQLLQAQKMETIGILAGGVAHDLNNVLSGIVSYPELLLMDIPEDSPLRKPILTIKKSGEKAAVIVQDLLTLARRGVAITEVLTLNEIISDYLKSPEHEKLKGFHPNVKFEMDFEKELLNILGSSVHLYKTIMNLTSNAAEAVPSGGKIFISTKNRYIDRPIKGYDDINEGDYVILTISDNGIGMTPMDMERVFEPFYTKKVMGRSGTGLGMAVVWGVVKDHNGYIDIQSREGKGTTFTLYFPVTRKDIAKDESILSLDDYMGKGESILVVDDVEEQGEIATGVLRKLGYSVTSVSSGEEAVEYMKNNSADLMVLDMIMDPGINGRETYERIINLHPNQKAVIASGFSETDDAKAALELGAGQYIKKPYTLEKIGIAVRDELRK